MMSMCEKTINDISLYFENIAIEAHVFGSMAHGTNDALSDIDIWITFEDKEIKKAIENRMIAYAQFGEIILLHEMQHNFPLNGIQTAIIYKIDGELVRVDYYLCPFSSSRVLPGSKILFEKKKVEIGETIPETKRTPRDISDRITFLICMCFSGIKKVIRKDETFMEFLISEFQKSEKEIPELLKIPRELSFDTLKESLAVLDTVSNQEQKKAKTEIDLFLMKVESLSK